MIVDYLMRKGRQDAPLLWCMLTGLVALPLAVAAYWVRDGWVSIVLIGLYFAFMLSSASMGPAAVQLVTPQHLRGRISALYVMATGLTAMAVGTTVVGVITDKVFADPARVGDSLIATGDGARDRPLRLGPGRPAALDAGRDRRRRGGLRPLRGVVRTWRLDARHPWRGCRAAGRSAPVPSGRPRTRDAPAASSRRSSSS
jgi:hypothetical protein